MSRLRGLLLTALKPTGAELFALTNTELSMLPQLLGSGFRGALIQIGKSGWSHYSTASTILLDLNRARSIFRLGVERRHKSKQKPPRISAAGVFIWWTQAGSNR